MPRGLAPMRRSEPKASAKKPRCSSASEKRVNSGGAPAKLPAGGGCLFDAANDFDAISAADIEQHSSTKIGSSRFIMYFCLAHDLVRKPVPTFRDHAR